MDPKVEALQARLSEDMAGAMATSIGYIGDTCGLFKALAKLGPCGPAALEQETNLNERYVLEWCRAATSNHYVEYDAEKDVFFMTDAQKTVLADEGGQFFMAAYFQFTGTCILAMPTVIQKGFKEGTGAGPEVFGQLGTYDAIGRMHASVFKYDLVPTIFAGIPGLNELLNGGARVLDVGCGKGGSTLAIASSYEAAHVVGVDCHQPSLDQARERCASAGATNTEFVCDTIESFAAKEESGKFDMILAFDTVHDMAQPREALAAMRGLLRDGNSLLVWSEPGGSVNPMENRTTKLRGRMGFSVLHCMTVSLAEGGEGLGTIIGVEGCKQLAHEAGFGRFEVLPPCTATQFWFGLRLQP